MENEPEITKPAPITFGERVAALFAAYNDTLPTLEQAGANIKYRFELLETPAHP